MNLEKLRFKGKELPMRLRSQVKSKWKPRRLREIFQNLVNQKCSDAEVRRDRVKDS